MPIEQVDAVYDVKPPKCEACDARLHLGGVDLLHPFDPDVAPYEPHSCTVYVTKLTP